MIATEVSVEPNHHLGTAEFVSGSPLRAAMTDFVEGVGRWRLWYLLGWQDIKQRYRRSTLGPFWLTLSMGVTMIVMGVIMSILLHSGFASMLPYVCTGLIVWTMITQTLTEGCTTFIDSSSLMLQMRMPLTVHIMRLVWRNVIVLAHNFLIFVIVAAIYRVTPTIAIFLFIPALLLVVANVCWIALLLAMMAARFRDLPMMVQNIITMMFWFTPIVYSQKQLGREAFVTALNPLSYLVELFRGPLLGYVPAALYWEVATGMMILGWTLAIAVFVRFRSRVAYWL